MRKSSITEDEPEQRLQIQQTRNEEAVDETLCFKDFPNRIKFTIDSGEMIIM